MTLAGLWSAALDVLLPATCAHCRRDVPGGAPLCPACARLPPAPQPACARCAAPRGSAGAFCAACADGGPFACRLVRAAAAHRGAAASLVHAFKFGGSRPAARAAGRAAAEALLLRPELAGFDAVAPVPAHPRRERERGYNQAELIAREVAAAAGAPLLLPLVRVRAGAPAWTLRRPERRAELSGAFALARGGRALVEGRRLLLVDDVAATGTTLEACARAAQEGGAADAVALVFARA